MTVRRILVAMVCALAGVIALASSESIALHYNVINGFPVKFVTVDMTDPAVVVTTALAPQFPTGLDSWGNFLNRLQPDAAINGTYFCLHTFMPVGDIAVDGTLCYQGVVGTALCITPDHHVTMLPGPYQTRPNWQGYRTVLCAGPRLLTAGQLTVNARAEGFRDPHVLGSAPRSAVAWRPDGILILLTIEQNISLNNLAYVCQSLGAMDAMALDGGNSSGLYAEGRTVTRPGRGLSNILVVYGSEARYQTYASRLIPERMRILARLLPTPPSGPTRPIAMAAPTTDAQPAAQPPTPLVRFVKPDPNQPVHGTVQVTVEVAKDNRLNWMSLKINGQLRAMTNIWPLEYQWDSTKEQDGVHTLEVTAWSENRAYLAHDIRQVQVHNAAQVAGR